MLSSSVHIEEPETGQVIVNVRVKLPEYLRSKRVISTKTCIEYEQVVSDRSEATEDVGLRMQQEHEEPAVEKLAMVPEPDESEEVQEPSSTTFDEESVSEMGVQETLDSQEESHEEIVAKAPPSFVVPEQLVPASVEVEAEDEEPQRDSFVEEQPKAAPESPQRPFWASGSSRPDENTSASAPASNLLLQLLEDASAEDGARRCPEAENADRTSFLHSRLLLVVAAALLRLVEVLAAAGDRLHRSRRPVVPTHLSRPMRCPTTTTGLSPTTPTEVAAAEEEAVAVLPLALEPTWRTPTTAAEESAEGSPTLEEKASEAVAGAASVAAAEAAVVSSSEVILSQLLTALFDYFVQLLKLLELKSSVPCLCPSKCPFVYSVFLCEL
ncbi:hypothetical protein L596_024393 [Steinernema carpocapsae]|uniref:Uncharacterized protein n=1 Tax=Steinernema carpocapsae TaxID=34508 RepID=A0A4U5MGM9_STECR|nr:hypothetical protein L596_024393 [Steinernema carpocapsae]